jgi:hypothetical protein
MTTITAPANNAAVNESKGYGRNPLVNFINSASELLGVCFSSPGSITSLESEHRSGLTSREKTEVDADLMGLR